MDPIFSVLVDVARVVTRQPPAIKQTWGVPERIGPLETTSEAEGEAEAEPVTNPGLLRLLLGLSLKPR